MEREIKESALESPSEFYSQNPCFAAKPTTKARHHSRKSSTLAKQGGERPEELPRGCDAEQRPLSDGFREVLGVVG